ncbi:MAG: linear amide C-N hydrolase [Carboxylicivirga sp.]|jgi:choloylglycine hydrolase|nr:linear amide C-N hydrolase [Carboxylicivirga sp.]
MTLKKTETLKISIVVTLGLILSHSLFACTTFVINDSTNLVFGRNFDWDIGLGMIVVNKKGLNKQAIVQAPHFPVRWISKYGSITFNQIGVDMPMGGMNEKGLVIAQMGLFESQFPEKIEQEVLNGLEWIQYQLDNSANLDEVIANNQKVQILPDIVPLHYMICDANGNVGVIEYLGGELVIKQGNDITIPVCSNMAYEKSQIAIKDYQPYGGTKKLPTQWNTIPDIIAKAGSMIENFNHTDNAIDFGFKILKAVGSETRTQWSLIFDIHNKTINFKTLNNTTTRVISLTDIDFNCYNDILMLDVHKAQARKPIINQFKKLTPRYYFQYKQTLIDLYQANFEGFPNIPDEVIKFEIDYAFNLRYCK